MSRIALGAALGAAAALLNVRADGRDRESRIARALGRAALGAGYTAVEHAAGLTPLKASLRLLTRGLERRHPPRPGQMRRGSRSRRENRRLRPARRGVDTSPGSSSQHSAAVRKLNLASSALAFSVVADSSLEHYRGGFHNRVMYLAPAVSALTLLAASTSVARPRGHGALRGAVFCSAAATGLIGTGFHTYNVLRREGGLGWLNLFYGAPIAAPLGITFAGIFGLAASRLSASRSEQAPRVAGLPAGRALAAAAAMGLTGTAVEAGLLHFRGAFHDPFMYIPVTVPPLAALALGAATLRADRVTRGTARALLWSTAAAGLAGMGFHAYGVHRNMGGWYNWTQMIQQGPPLPAPPSFTGMALAGLAALDLMEHGAHG